MSRQATPDRSSLQLIADVLVGRRVASDVDANAWPQIPQRAEHHGLAPMLYAALRLQDLPGEAQPALQSLAVSVRQHAVHWMLLERAQVEIAQALDHAGIPAIWLKGGALAHTLYPDPALRPMVDLDVLVPFDQREDALRVVQSTGYDFYEMDESLLGRSDNVLRQKLSHHYHLRDGPGGHVILELHFRLLSYDDSSLSLDDHAWFWSQRTPVRLSDGTMLDTLSPDAHLLYLCAHALIQHGRDDFRLLRYLDIHLLIQFSYINWTVVTERAIQLGWTPAVEETLRMCRDYFATELPEDVLHRLAQSRSALGVERVERMAGAGNRWERVRTNLRALSVREAIVYAAQIVIPRPPYMRSRYRVPEGRPVWPYYLRRWADQGSEVAASTWKWLTGRYR
ncbi:MAG: nucleotidyltransferase family protein [Chloroflexi bacterium]|nr:nucleotidyltransferase family protein [Chloroflexota bacterium]